jgi:hypothetical protein
VGSNHHVLEEGLRQKVGEEGIGIRDTGTLYDAPIGDETVAPMRSNPKLYGFITAVLRPLSIIRLYYDHSDSDMQCTFAQWNKGMFEEGTLTSK